MREDWVELPLIDILATLETGKRPKGGVNGIWEGVPSIGGEHLNNQGGFKFDNLKYVPLNFAELMTKGIIEENNILIVKDGATTGKVSFVDNSFIHNHAVINEHIFKCKVLEGLYSKFNFYFLFSHLGQKRILENFKGSAQGGINTSFAPNTIIPLSPIPEQRAIVSKIEQLFSDLDNGIENLKTAQDQLKVYRQAVLKKAFEGEFTKEWRDKQSDLPSAEELLVQIKEERAAHYQKQVDDWELAVNEWEESGKEGRKPSKPKEVKELSLLMKEDFIELPDLPDEWVWIKSENVHGFITKGTTPKKNELFANRGEIPFIKVYNLTFNGSLDFTINPTFVSEETHSSFLNRSIVYPNDVLMNIVGPPLGKVSIVPTTYHEWNINQAIARFRPYKILLSKYLALFLSSKHTIHRVSKMAKATAGQFNLTLEICRNISIPICSSLEQTQIVQEIESRLSVCDKVEETIKDSLKKAEALRQSILKKAFEGRLLNKAELDACRKEADWEPAAMLLERIKRERSK